MAPRKPAAPSPFTPYAPRRPTLLALGFLTLWIAVLCAPMLAGRFLAGPESDQIWSGYPFRWWGAQMWRLTGQIPQWNPYLFGGLPFIAAQHGDIFYPTALLRLVLPVDVAMNVGFATHLVLAGAFAYLFLRSLDVTWTGSVVGGVAYQLSGIVASLVRPGHDGKLFVSALLPLALLGLVVAVKRRRLEGYGILALTVGLGVLSPHYQMTYYLLIAAGLFALYVAFLSEERPARAPERWAVLGLGLGAVALGFGAAMIQLWPFTEYLKYAARSAGARGWEYATSYAMPPENILDWLVPEFTGILRSYWGSNFFKLHSEYLGAAALVLATAGAANRARRRILWWCGAVGVLFLLVSLGGHSPFYELWYGVMPGVRFTRAPGMAFFIPAFVVSMLAAFGVERLERGEGRRAMAGWLIGAGVLLLLGVSGALGELAQSLAAPQRIDAAFANAGAIQAGAVRSALFAGAAAGLGLAALRGKPRGMSLAVALALLVGADLWVNARRFFTFSPRATRLYADDPVTARLSAAPRPYRVLDLDAYPGSYLMAKEIPVVLGHHGNELHNYDQLLGGKNVWANLGRQLPNGTIAPSATLWNLLAVRYAVLPAQGQILGYHLILGPATTTQGSRAYLYERDTPAAYARVVPAAAKLPDERIVPTLLDPSLDPDRVLLVADDAPVNPPRLDSIPQPSASRATVTVWEPGRMSIRLDPPPESAAYLLVSENYYPDWRAAVDGRPAQVLRGDYTFIAVPIERGAGEVTLRFDSQRYRAGSYVSIASLTAILVWLALPLILRRRRG